MENTKEPDHLNLLFSISELVDIVTSSSDIHSFLQHAVELVARHLHADVCSIYLFDEKTNRLVLKATRGLNIEAVDKISMEPGEGLVGASFETMTVIREGNAGLNPRFKYFAEAGEEPYKSFLCVPIKRGIEKIGVLVVQHRNYDYFNVSDERAIRTAVSQLAGALENVKLLMELLPARHDVPDRGTFGLIKGEAASGGYALGRAIILDKQRKSILYHSSASQQAFTGNDFKRAVDKTIHELKDLQKRFEQRLPESASLIFTAHFMILKDQNFMGKIKALIREGTPPYEAVRKTAREYIALFSSSPHAYIREKALDVEDLSVRILNNFRRQNVDDRIENGGIVISREIYPSDILKMVSSGVRGIILAGGGATSHVSILSRSLQIPLIIAEDPRLLNIPENTTILMDAEVGNLYIHPDHDTIRLFETRKQVEKASRRQEMHEQTRTLDGKRVRLLANINLLSEVSLARSLKAEGIGLYRTEFPFLVRSTFPSEEEQYVIYKRLFGDMPGRPITIRTLDAGGEKTLAYADCPAEANPELGLRSIRFSLKYTETFKAQIRAILRASKDIENIGIMFPLISSIDEFIQAKQILMDCMQSLSDEQLDFNKSVAVGMMIELPSVLETIEEFARHADFFSIGTNDFIQYMLGADRSNKLVADHYIPYHPAINRGIDKIVKAGRKHGIGVSVCGEMAHEPEYIPFLLGVGMRHLSVDPRFLPEVQQTIMNLNMADAQRHAKKLLEQTCIKDARGVLQAWKQRTFKKSPDGRS